MSPEAPVFISSMCNSKNSFSVVSPLSVINSPREVSVHNYRAYLMHVNCASHWAKHSTLFMSFNLHTSSGSPYLSLSCEWGWRRLLQYTGVASGRDPNPSPEHLLLCGTETKQSWFPQHTSDIFYLLSGISACWQHSVISLKMIQPVFDIFISLHRSAIKPLIQVFHTNEWREVVHSP